MNAHSVAANRPSFPHRDGIGWHRSENRRAPRHHFLDTRGSETGYFAPMSDLRDPTYAERLAREGRDEYLRRREFLQRTAMTAGLATGLATILSPDVLVAEAGKRQHRRHLPSPKNMPIDTF